MAYALLVPTYFHAKCGERIEAIMYADRAGGFYRCPKHPALAEIPTYTHHLFARP